MKSLLLISLARVLLCVCLEDIIRMMMTMMIVIVIVVMKPKVKLTQKVKIERET